jgi:uncharacterized lipoprotein YbaY
MMKHLLLIVALVGLFACGTYRQPEPAAPGTLSVKLQLPEAAPASSEVYIRVVEVSGPDRALVGSLKAKGDLPEYRIPYRKERIKPDQSYGLEIVMMVDGKSAYLNKKPYFVITKGNPETVTAELEKR